MIARIFNGTVRVDAIAPDDRGLAYGDGLFETMRVHRGSVPWWDAHWARLARGAYRLRLHLPDEAQARSEATALFADGSGGVLKLLVTRGSGGRGYLPSPDAVPTWFLSRHEPPPPRRNGLQLRWCETRLALQPALAGLKHCNRLEQVLARAECADTGMDEGLMRDNEGFVVSATAANLFVLGDGRWTTPPVDRCGVAGVCRAHLLPLLDAHEERLSVENVESADAVFLCNAVRGILPVARLDARAWTPHPAVDGVRRELLQIHPGFAIDAENS
ncbi:MAG: aminodeoxychorismate lyase [Luteimonas sp.]